MTSQGRFISGTLIQSLTAVDADDPSSPNGQVGFRIQSGSAGKFQLDGNDVITSTTFDIQSDRTDTYTMIVSVFLPPKTANAVLCSFS